MYTIESFEMTEKREANGYTIHERTAGRELKVVRQCFKFYDWVRRSVV